MRKSFKILGVLILGISLTIGSFNAYAQKPKKINLKEKINLDYNNADIRDVAKQISELLGKNIIFDSGVSGKITMYSPVPVTIKQAYEAFISALNVRGYVISATENFIKIIQKKQGAFSSIPTGVSLTNTDLYVTKLITVKYIDAEEIQKILKPMVGEGNIIAYAKTNTLIITDTSSNIKRLMKILKKLDVKGFEQKVEFIRLTNAAALDVATKIAEILQIKSKEQKTSTYKYRYSSKKKDEKAEKEFITSIIADERTNSIIVRGNAKGIQEVKKLAAHLDSDLSNEMSKVRIFVHRLEHAEAGTVADILGQILSNVKGMTKTASIKGKKDSKSKSKSFGGGGKMGDEEIKVTADEKTNSLVIVCTQTAYEMVLPVIRKLDTKRKQVHIDASIMEVTLTDTLDFGAAGHGGYGFDGGVDDGGFNILGGVNPKDSTNAAAIKDLAGLVMGVFAAPITVAGLNIPGFAAFLKASEVIKDYKMVSKPSILTLDNQEATIEIGEKIYIKKSVLTSRDSGSQEATYEPEDVTLKLVIKPKISKNNFVTMEIHQQYNTLGAKQDATAASPRQIKKREAKTIAMAKSKETIAIGGLISEEETDTVSKVPGLGDIPVLGWLFKNKYKEIIKKNLIIFITPTVLESSQDISNMNREIVRRRSDFYERNGIEMDDWIGATKGTTHPGGVVITYGKDKQRSSVEKGSTAIEYYSEESGSSEDGLYEFVKPTEEEKVDIEYKE